MGLILEYIVIMVLNFKKKKMLVNVYRYIE